MHGCGRCSPGKFLSTEYTTTPGTATTVTSLSDSWIHGVRCHEQCFVHNRCLSQPENCGTCQQRCRPLSSQVPHILHRDLRTGLPGQSDVMKPPGHLPGVSAAWRPAAQQTPVAGKTNMSFTIPPVVIHWERTHPIPGCGESCPTTRVWGSKFNTDLGG